jgi:hypothetical protein
MMSLLVFVLAPTRHFKLGRSSLKSLKSHFHHGHGHGPRSRYRQPLLLSNHYID